jgi:uncharacterized protein
MAHRALISLTLWLCLALASWVQPVAAAPLTFPALTGRVVDEAGLLSPAERAALSNALADLEARTTDQVVVVTLKSLRGTSIEDYGYQLGRHWGVGQKDKDSGALLIVAPADRQVRIEVGYGLEGTLTDAATKIIIETAILPAFKSGDIAGGIRNGTAQIIHVLDADEEAAPPTKPAARVAPATGQLTWPAIAGSVFFVILLIFCAIHGGGLCSVLLQILYLVMLSGRGGSSRDDGPRFSGGGGSFGGGGSSGSW